jgi:hypothetical protein
MKNREIKNVWIGKWVYRCVLRRRDPRYWDCGTAWGPTPKAAAAEAHKHGAAMAARSVAELNEMLS